MAGHPARHRVDRVLHLDAPLLEPVGQPAGGVLGPGVPRAVPGALAVVGREAGVAALERFLDGVSEGPGAFLVRGGPGIGKTALWEAGIDAARERGLHVLSARAAEAERGLSFTTLADLLEDIASFGTTVLVATHNVEIVKRMQRRVLTLVDGRLVRDQPAGRVGRLAWAAGA